MADAIFTASCVPRCPARAALPAVLALTFALFAFPANVSAVDIIARYVGGTVSANIVADGVTASDMGLSINSNLTGFTALATGGNPGFAFEATGWTAASDPDPDSAFVFTLQSNSFDLSLLSFSVDVRPQGAGPQQLAISYQIDSAPIQLFATAQFTPAASAESTDTFTNWAELQFTGGLSVAANSTVTFFISGFDAKNSGKTMQVDNVSVAGDVVPEPQVLVLLAMAVPALLWLRKLRSRSMSSAPVA